MVTLLETVVAGRDLLEEASTRAPLLEAAAGVVAGAREAEAGAREAGAGARARAGVDLEAGAGLTKGPGVDPGAAAAVLRRANDLDPGVEAGPSPSRNHGPVYHDPVPSPNPNPSPSRGPSLGERVPPSPSPSRGQSLVNRYGVCVSV